MNISEKQLEKINKFTRRNLSADEIQIFKIILCNNDIDKDYNCLSNDAIESLKELYIGKTTSLLMDDGKNILARIFDTEIITDSSIKTETGEDYKYLMASLFIIKSDENLPYLSKFSGAENNYGTISYSVNTKECSICHCNQNRMSCEHIKGKTYEGNLCYTILKDVMDAYEWDWVKTSKYSNSQISDNYSLYMDKEKISASVQNLANTINAFCVENSIDSLVVISVLDGSLYFTADITRKINCTQELRTVHCKSYENNKSSDNLVFTGDLEGLHGRAVLIIDDVYDTGRTMNFLINECTKHGAYKILPCVFIDKTYMHPNDKSLIFSANQMTSPGFLIGYGMDDNGIGRNLESIYTLKT